MAKKKHPTPVVIEIPPIAQAQKGQEMRKLRTCAYCRVSTDTVEQETSYNSQVEFYSDYIARNPKWVFSGIYADKGISGKFAPNRPQFLQMIKDCEAGQIDMIITKSISRFARNTRDSIFYIRLLRDKGIPIFFEKECLNSMDHNVDLILTILSAIAEEESRSMSGNIKSAFAHNASLGRISILHECYGYRKAKNRSLVIIPKEAHIIMRIFNEFEDGKHMTAIAKGLERDGIPAPSKKSFRWHSSVIAHILKNEKYVGDIYIQKTFSRDFLSKRQKNNGEVRMWLVKDCHEPIITRQQFDHVQELLNNPRSINYHESNLYPLSSLITCRLCGRRYYRRYRINGDTMYGTWQCHGRELKNCSSRIVKEDDIFQAVLSVTDNIPIEKIRTVVKQIFVDGDNLSIEFLDGTSTDYTLPPRNKWKK